MRINYENMGYNNTPTEMSATKTASPAVEPVSRTYQYRKVMKPMLERKRRARINRCLDELKELMVTALQSEGENVSKLEKADILELTVKHLHKLRHQKRLTSANPVIDADRFRAGFRHAADEVSRCLATIPNVDVPLGTKLMTHLAHRLNEMDKVQPLTIQVNYNSMMQSTPMTTTTTTPTSLSSISSNCSSNDMMASHYQMPLTPASSARSTPTTSPQPADYHHYHHSVIQHTQGLLKVVPIIDLKVWRPW